MSERSDAHWSYVVPPKSKDLSKEALNAYKTAKLYSCFVRARDGTKLAVDVMLPQKYDGKTAVPCVLFQARYTRGLYLRFPFRLMTDGRPYDFINIAFKAEQLLAGYAVISMDFRGTGASFGQWRLPWGLAERQDSIAVLDWMTGQPWCNGKVVLCGQSYDATAALFTTSLQHPAIKGVVALYPFWDLYHDIAIPGGIAMKSFSEAWANFCKGMDYNDYSILQAPAKQLLKTISKGCNPVVCYDGARLTARSFADMTQATRLLLRSLTHPTRLLTLNSGNAALANGPSARRSLTQGTSASTTAPPPQQAAASTQQSDVKTNGVSSTAANGIDTASSAGPFTAAATQQPVSDIQPSSLTQSQSTEHLRQLSLDAASDQHQYRSWNRTGVQQLLGSGPVVNNQTIPARGISPEGVSAHQLHISVRRHYKEKGKRLLQAAVAEHDTWDSAAAMKSIRFTDQQAAKTNATTADASLCSKAQELKQANVPLQLVSGWLDSTASAAINLFHHCGQAPGSELVLGPWSHGGIMDQSVAAKSSFDQPKHSMAFINRCCDHTPSTQNQSAESQAQQDPAQHAQRSRHQLPGLTGDAHDEHFNGLLSANLSPGTDAEGATVQLPGFEDSSINSNSNSNLIFESSAPAGPRASDAARQRSQKAAQDAASPSVHYFMMGSDGDRGWKACHSWPPPNASSPPLKLYLNKAAEPAGKLSRSWFRSGKKSAKVANTEPAPAIEPLQQPLGLHNRQHASGQASTSASQNQHAWSSTTNSSGLLHSQQPRGQQTSDAGVNPRPVSAQQGQMPVNQVVAPKKRPQLGLLTQSAAQQNCRFRHDIDLDKHIKGLSRYDAISKITKSMHYDNLGKCNHLVFMGQPLPVAAQIVGAVGVELWIECSGQDTDVFAYLEDVSPLGDIRYVTEGMFRASHRTEYLTPPPQDPRARSNLPGEPFHSFREGDAQPMPPGQAVLCRFQMMPTAYSFAKGHSIRLAISGADSKHFYVDHMGTKTLWVHTGPGRQSSISLYVIDS